MSSNKDTIQKNFDVLRQNLLDLTMRNQLLNFRPRTRVIRVVDEISTEIFDILVLQEKSMTFLPKDEAEDDETKEKESELTPEEKDLLWELPPPDVAVDDRHIDLFLQTNHKSKDLQKRLFNISQQAKSVFEEQGYNILYLTLGFLEWYESPQSDNVRKAPLIIIPVYLEREGVKRSFKIQWSGEDILTNISLKEKLKEQGITLPDFEMPEHKEGIYNYFQAVKNSISHLDDWNVQNDIYLGFFSFTKFVMYQDLDMANWPSNFSFDDNLIINELFNPSEHTNDFVFNEEEIDIKLNANQTYTVLDADSSQLSVIEDIKQGKNLVVEGPPGTGKSQTIVNLIAELLASEKTVLFVSEKMAALEVVKSRLDSIGLGKFCLELHSRHANKKEVLNELQRTLKSSQRTSEVSAEFEELDHLKNDLNSYKDAIHQTFGNVEFTPFYLYGLKEQAQIHFESKGKQLPIVNIENVNSYSREDWHNALNKLKDITEILKAFQPLSEHPWRYCKPDTIIPTDQHEINELLESSLKHLDDINSELEELNHNTGILVPNNIEKIDESILNALEISKSITTEQEVLNNSQWDSCTSQTKKIISNVRDYNNQLSFLKSFKNDVLEEDLETPLRIYEEQVEKTLKILSGDYRKTKKIIKSFYIKEPGNDSQIIADLRNLIACQKLRNDIRQSEPDAIKLFGSKWSNEDTDPESLYEISQWILGIRNLLNTGKITLTTLNLITKGIDTVKVQEITSNLQLSVDQFLTDFNELYNRLKFDTIQLFKPELSKAPFIDMQRQLKIFKKELPKLSSWSQFLYEMNQLPPLTTFIKSLIWDDQLDPDDLIPTLKGNFADNLLKEVFLKEPDLRNFVADTHENKIKKFNKLDQQLLNVNRNRINTKLSSNLPNMYASRNSELGILQQEFQRKRRHLPIRKLLSAAGGLIKTIKPCFMMSPLSIAQYIDPESVNNLIFDVVIFDEASQVKPEDALGALLRGKQLVLMGDTKQLPPTAFFDLISQSEEESDYETDALVDMESILHLCKLSYPTKMLRWHYRSRHESLIAVSNQEFYDNYLYIYPSPEHDSDTLGLKFKHIQDAVYDKGLSSVNLIEARAVVEAAFEHFKRYGSKKSLGIGTFNIRQQQAIYEVLELELKRNPELEDYFTSNREEHFFVKNLETIQGDERDVILISVGFGFDSNNKLSQNFGPLNKEGGERRLNVLITRAREKCVIFSNFKHSDLRVGNDSSKGLKSLKVFLEYAETKNLVADYIDGQEFDSPFEESVYELIRSFGYEVRKQVGCAGYRIDLAVVDPQSPGRFLLGIECDGAMYHSSPVARDRDRLRQQILEGLNWKIYRIWSTDWYKNRPDSVRRLLQVIEESKKPVIPIMEEVEEEIVVEPVEIEEIFEMDSEIDIKPIKLEDTIPEYQIFEAFTIIKNCDLHEKSKHELANAITQIVEFESPVHIEDVIRRLRTYWGLKKAGKRIRNTIIASAEVAQRNGKIVIEDDFLFHKNKEIVVRRRNGDLSPNIEFISPAEIEKALIMVIENYFATPQDELVTQTSRIFGFKSTRANTATKINQVIDGLLNKDELIKMPNEMINIPK